MPVLLGCKQAGQSLLKIVGGKGLCQQWAVAVACWQVVGTAAACDQENGNSQAKQFVDDREALAVADIVVDNGEVRP